jgi:hypothetical protein
MAICDAHANYRDYGVLALPILLLFPGYEDYVTLFWPVPLFLLSNTQTMHFKSFYTQQHRYVSLKTFYPGGIRTRVFFF